jgi:hypothetical protein
MITDLGTPIMLGTREWEFRVDPITFSIVGGPDRRRAGSRLRRRSC